VEDEELVADLAYEQLDVHAATVALDIHIAPEHSSAIQNVSPSQEVVF
jgi:hypothetical protein